MLARGENPPPPSVSSFLQRSQAVTFTSEPDERFFRKLSSAVCALWISPVLSADPICESRLLKELLLDEELDVELLASVDEVLDVESPEESNRLLSES